MGVKCDACGLLLSNRQHLKRHENTYHKGQSSLEIKPIKFNFTCSVCGESKSSRDNFLEHLETAHDYSLTSETKIFESFDEFLKWKSDFEAADQNKFVLERGNATIPLSTRKVIDYRCHRAGNYTPEGKGTRHLKTQGSKKINGYCPAKIKLTALETGQCVATIFHPHWGHNGDELSHLHLTPGERNWLAGRIASKIPFTDILNGIRGSITNPDELKRIHLTTRKDLHNIESGFNLSSEAVRHKSDPISVDAWVREKAASSENCVLFYKPQGVSCQDHPCLSEGDFMLAIMNEAQRDMLKRFGNDAICIDGTHGLNAYDFQLITIMVITDTREGFPCAFLFTNRTDKDALKIFFSEMKCQVPELEPPNVFMSDMEASFYNAWVEVVGPSSRRLWCTWHVERAWRKNLSKIKTSEKKKETYKLIKTLMEEQDGEAFETALRKAVLNMTNDEETQDFGKYFQEHYVSNATAWAFCHRINSGLNTNMHLENLHKCLKHHYLLGMKVKRLDKALFALMNFLRDKMYNRLIALNRGNIPSKLKILRQRHKASTEMSIEKVVPNGGVWNVASSNGLGMYTVSVRTECSGCRLLCVECNQCFHKYSCTCPDSSISFNMCKHIHLVGIYLLNPINAIPTSSFDEVEEKENAESLLIDEEDERSHEKGNLVKQICADRNDPEAASLQSKKDRLISTLTSLLVQARSFTSAEEVESLTKSLQHIQPTIAAVRASHEMCQKYPFIETDQSRKRKMDLQPRFFSTKNKKKKKNNNNSLTKPKQEEKDRVMYSLLQPTIPFTNVTNQ